MNGFVLLTMMTIVRRRSVLSKLAFALLVTFALASHHNGAVDAYKIVQYRIQYPQTVNDNDGQDNRYYYPSQKQRQQQPDLTLYKYDYDYDHDQNGFQPESNEQQPTRFASNIALQHAGQLLSKYKTNPMKNYQDKQIQDQVEEFLRTLYDFEQQQKQSQTKDNEKQEEANDDQEISNTQNVLKSSLPQPMKKESNNYPAAAVDPLENELFGIQKKPLEDAETMDKDNTNDDAKKEVANTLLQSINRESVSNQNYADMGILKRKLISQQQTPSASLIKSEPNQASYEHYRQLSNSFPQSHDSNTNSNLTFLSSMSDIYFVAMVVCVSSVAICSVIGAGYCFYKVQQNNRQAVDVEFPSYGVIGPNVDGDCGINSLNGSALTSKCSPSPADRKLTQAAQMYHYQHQRQQMISNERNVVRICNHGTANSDLDSDEENEDGEYTVYECPGLASTDEMEVKNPLFQDDATPLSSPSVQNEKSQTKK